MTETRELEVKSPEGEAERLLNTVWSDIRGFRGMPVDPIRIATHLGIDVAEAEFDQEVAGAIVKERGSDPTILLNRFDHSHRQRFTTAHELGHYIKRVSDPDEYEYVDYRDQMSSTGADADERFANAFAAGLLMPEFEIREGINKGLDIVGLAYQFRVSQDAMTFRLKNLGLILG